MNRLLSALHPTFDALSAHADRSDVDGARSRIGGHVARCATCREVVAEIRALGDVARATPVHGAPSDLWSRIESEAKRASRPDAAIASIRARGARGHVDEIAPAGGRTPPDTGRRGRFALIGVGSLVAAAALLAVVAWPRQAGLQAAGTSRLSVTPGRPIPGGTVRVRYLPAPWMADAAQLVLVGRFAQSAGRNPMRFGGRAFDALGDSLGVLARAADGAFVATIRLPADFLAVSLTVLDASRDEHDMDGARPWVIIGGTSTRAPSFASLVAAHEIAPGWFGGDIRYRPRQMVDVADSLKRYFPSHPAGWAFSRSYGVAQGRFDLFRFFQSAERKYASMFEALWPTQHLDAERLHDMVEFANNIEEPDEALRWAARLVEEHPEDPRALIDLAEALRAIELREPPSLADSLRRWMPSLDRAYRAGPVPNQGFSAALRLAASYGDSATRTLWIAREAEHGGEGNIYMMARWLATPQRERASRDNVARELRTRLGQGCALPPGRLPLTETVRGWRTRCEQYRGMTYGALSTQTLLDGDARRGFVEADSALAAMRRGEFCAPSLGYINRARATLALGDTARAETDFVHASAAYPTGVTTLMDTARAYLGGRFDEARYVARVDTAHRAAMECQRVQRARWKAREDRRRGPLPR